MKQRDEPSGGVLIVGSIAADLTVYSTRVPERGETLIGDEFTLRLGGKGANQAVAVARSEGQAFLVGCVGDDVFGDMVSAELHAADVDMTGVREIRGVGTGIAHIRVDRAGENDIVMVPRANAEVTPDDVAQAVARCASSASALLAQLETPVEVVRAALRSARAAGMTVVLDPAPAQPLDDAVWADVDVVTPNETEARALTGVEIVDLASAVASGRWFTDRGAGCAVITLAGDGAVAVSAEDVVRFAPLPVDVVDTTAAGDAFAGCLAAGLAAGLRRDTAIRRAMAAGALAVTRAGAASSIPRLVEVERLLADAATDQKDDV